MESIIRGIGSATLTVAFGIAGQSSFTAIDASRALPYSRNQRRFPVFLGSTGGQTWIKIFEFDSSSNIGVGGSSTDSSFLSTAGN